MANNIEFATNDEFLDAIRNGQNIRLSSFLLPDGPILDELVSAAERGANVDVVLAGDHFARSIDDIRTANDEAKVRLRKAGATVSFNRNDSGEQRTLHAKLAEIDGVGYLDERNWTGNDTLFRTTNTQDVAAIDKAIDQEPANSKNLKIVKSDALAQEAEFIRNAPGHDLTVATESFGPNDVADAIKERAEAGDNVRFMMVGADVHARAQEAIDDLSSAGVEVRLNKQLGSEKMAIADDKAWVGSSNATAGRPNQVDWGAITDDDKAIESLKEHFEEAWKKAEPVQEPVQTQHRGGRGR